MTPPAVRAVLADLDDTLFDHTAATRRSLARLCDVEPHLAALPFDDLVSRHRDILEELHLEVLAGRRTIDAARDERFRRLLSLVRGVPAGDVLERARSAAAFYRRTYQETWALVPGAMPLLEALRTAGVPVAIVTNNSTIEQQTKIARTGMTPFIRTLITSEAVGATKPDRRIFEAALDGLGLVAEDVVMVGDAWDTDIAGARAAGIRAVWFNRWHQPSPDGAVEAVTSLEPTEPVVGVLLGTSLRP